MPQSGLYELTLRNKVAVREREGRPGGFGYAQIPSSSSCQPQGVGGAPIAALERAPVVSVSARTTTAEPSRPGRPL